MNEQITIEEAITDRTCDMCGKVYARFRITSTNEKETEHWWCQICLNAGVGLLVSAFHFCCVAMEKLMRAEGVRPLNVTKPQ